MDYPSVKEKNVFYPSKIIAQSRKIHIDVPIVAAAEVLGVSHASLRLDDLSFFKKKNSKKNRSDNYPTRVVTRIKNNRIYKNLICRKSYVIYDF